MREKARSVTAPQAAVRLTIGLGIMPNIG